MSASPPMGRTLSTMPWPKALWRTWSPALSCISGAEAAAGARRVAAEFCKGFCLVCCLISCVLYVPRVVLPQPPDQPSFQLSSHWSAFLGSGFPSQRIFSAGISSRNREGIFGSVWPKSIRWRTLVMVRVLRARVMAT